MTPASLRLERERRTVTIMIVMYCRGIHKAESLCPDCASLQAYALDRLEKCRFGEDKPAGLSRAVLKPTCANCTVHCYATEKRERVRVVMRYAGPRMLLRYPVLALMHLWDGRKIVIKTI